MSATTVTAAADLVATPKLLLSKNTVKFSTILRNVVNVVYLELDSLLTTMASQTSALRTSKLKLFCQRTCKRFAQLIVIFKWISGISNNTTGALNQNNVLRFLEGIKKIQDDSYQMENQLNHILTLLYNIHSNLYSKRTRELDIKTSIDIITNSYYIMPTCMFPTSDMHEKEESGDAMNAGDPATPYNVYNIHKDAIDIWSENIFHCVTDKNKKQQLLATQLNTLIKYKLMYLENIKNVEDYIMCDNEVPVHLHQNTDTNNNRFQIHIHNGTVEFKVVSFYKILLTLEHLDIEAPWKLLNFEFLINSDLCEQLSVLNELQHPSCLANKKIDLKKIELNVIKNCIKICENYKFPGGKEVNKDPVSNENLKVDFIGVDANEKKEESTEMEVEVGSVIAKEEDPSVGMEIEPESKNALEQSKNPMNKDIEVDKRPNHTLGKMLIICQYACTSIILRYLFLQALVTSRTLYPKALEVLFHEEIRLKHLDLKIYEDLMNHKDKVYASVLKLKFWRDTHMR